MLINFSIPRQTGAPLSVPLDDGECIFLLGANGTGKSSLMHALYTPNSGQAHRIAAHRQTWFASSSLSLSPEQRRQTQDHIQGTDSSPYSRWRDDYSAQRATIAIYDLIDAENVRARGITAAVDADNHELVQVLRKNDAPIKVINELLKLSNIPIKISVHKNEEVMASKEGGPNYSVAELSDGERNALLIAATVLTVPSHTLLLIDEPERHLHRSIVSPLLTLLFQKRSDCKFVVSTHDIQLSLDNPTARAILVRGCAYSGNTVTHWDVDVAPASDSIDESMRRDLLGSRRTVLFIEGADDTSLDKPLYSLIFPHVSIIAKGSCREVETSVRGMRSAPELHWIRAFGILDSDRRTATDIALLKEQGIYAISVYMVESIYYHPEIQRRIAERHSSVTGEVADAKLAAAKVATLNSVQPHVKRLSSRAVEKRIREKVEALRPTQTQIAAGTPINVTIDVASELASEQISLGALITSSDVTSILCKYPVRETPALTQIATRLGFQGRCQYESAVRKLVLDDETTLTFVRSLFGTLHADLSP